MVYCTKSLTNVLCRGYDVLLGFTAFDNCIPPTMEPEEPTEPPATQEPEEEGKT